MNVHTYLTIRGEAEAEYVDRRSRFIAAICPVTDESEALAFIAARKKQFWDARHNVHAYVLRSGVQRFSDDGEPQGTAGMPVLETLQKRGLTDCVVVVTRYFGGILLGAGGLTRAYGTAAKLALNESGISRMRLWATLALACSYALYERMRLVAEQNGGIITETDFGADVTLTVILPAEDVEDFRKEVTELTAGSVETLVLEEQFMPGPRENAR